MAEFRYALCGEIDIARWGEVRDGLFRELGGRCDGITVDCAELRFIDGGAMAILLDACEAVERRGGRFRVVNLPPPQRRLFDALDLTDRLHVVGSEDATPDAQCA